jgi:hypothetical protein
MKENKTWFQKKMEKYQDDPEFLHGYIELLTEENEFLRNQNSDLAKAIEKLKKKTKRRN